MLKAIQKYTNKKKNMNTNEAKYNVIVKTVLTYFDELYNYKFMDDSRDELKRSYIKSIIVSLKSKSVTQEKMLFVEKINDQDILIFKEELSLIKRYLKKPKWNEQSKKILIGEVEERILSKLKELKLFMGKYR